MFPRRRRTSAFEMHPDSCNGSSSALASFGLVEMKLNARRRPLLCVCPISVQSAFASFLACLCKRSGADPRGLWDAANKRQTNPEDTPRPRPSMMAPILAHQGSPPLGATAVASFFCKCRRYLVWHNSVLLVVMMRCMPITVVVAMTIVWLSSLRIRSQHRRRRYRQAMPSNRKTSDIQRWPC